MMEDAYIRARNSYVDPVEIIQIGKVSRFVTVGGEDTEHAEELVRRWNSYDALVDALRMVVDTAADDETAEGWVVVVDDAAIVKARAALKIAEGDR